MTNDGEDKTKMVMRRLADADTIGFEIDYFPAPLEYKGGSGQLSWAQPLDLPAEDQEKWETVRAEVEKMINKTAEVHVPADESVTKAFKTYPWEPPGDLCLYDIESLFKLELLPLEVLGAPLVPRNLRIVKECRQWMRKDAIW